MPVLPRGLRREKGEGWGENMDEFDTCDRSNDKANAGGEDDGSTAPLPEKFLADKDPGESIIRPGSRGPSYLTSTLKVYDGVYAHKDIVKGGKEHKDISSLLHIRKTLKIGDTFEDLDESTVLFEENEAWRGLKWCISCPQYQTVDQIMMQSIGGEKKIEVSLMLINLSYQEIPEETTP